MGVAFVSGRHVKAFGIFRKISWNIYEINFENTYSKIFQDLTKISLFYAVFWVPRNKRKFFVIQLSNNTILITAIDHFRRMHFPILISERISEEITTGISKRIRRKILKKILEKVCERISGDIFYKKSVKKLKFSKKYLQKSQKEILKYFLSDYGIF